jgi:hypothetical protein
MPYSKKFKKLLKSTQKQYGKKDGLRIAHAIAQKRNWRH